MTTAPRPAVILSALECRRVVTNRAVRVVALAMACLAAVATTLGLRAVESARQDFAGLLRDQVTAQVNAAPVMPWAPDVRLRVIRSPIGAWSVARGASVSLPAYWDFGPSGVVWGPHYRAYTESVGRDLDVRDIVRTMAGLLAGLLGVELVLAGRRSGTTAGWLRLPLEPVTVAVAKLAGLSVSALAAVVAVLVGIFAAMVFGQTDEYSLAGSEVVAVFVTIGLPGLVYLCLQGVTGASIAAFSRSEVRAHVSLIMVWMGTAIVGPYLVEAVPQVLFGPPARNSMEYQRIGQFATGIRGLERALGAQVEADLRPDASVDELDTAMMAMRGDLERVWATGFAQVVAAAAATDRFWWEQRRRQERASRWLGLGSPGTLFDRAVEALSGSGAQASESWHVAVEQYYERLEQAMFADWPGLTIRARGSILRLDRHPPPRLAELPQFAPPADSLRTRLQAAALPLTVMALYAALVAVIGARRFARSAE